MIKQIDTTQQSDRTLHYLKQILPPQMKSILSTIGEFIPTSGDVPIMLRRGFNDPKLWEPAQITIPTTELILQPDGLHLVNTCFQ